MQVKEKPARLETLRHASYEIMSEAVAERNERLVRNVVLLGTQSRNGYRYSHAAMQSAIPLYENRPVFLDHAEEHHAPMRRRLRDYAGQVLSPRFEDGKLRGDLRLLGPHTSWLFDLMEAAPHDIGMSHVVLGRRSAQSQEVEHIERVVSVDIVAFPATTQSFQEGDTGDSGVQHLLQQSSLPALFRTDAIREALAMHPEPAQLLKLLEEWAALLDRDASPSSLKRSVPEEIGASAKQALVRAIRG